MQFVRFVVPLGIVLVGCNGEELPVGPTADYTWLPNCNLVPDIGFSADVSQQGDASIHDYFWDFGHDGIIEISDQYLRHSNTSSHVDCYHRESLRRDNVRIPRIIATLASTMLTLTCCDPRG